MFKQIMVPVDLHMGAEVTRALNVSADLAKHYGAKVTLVSVSGSVITDAPHTEKEAREALDALAATLKNDAGIEARIHLITSTDVPAEVDAALRHSIDDTNADLVIMGSHVPGILEYLLPSHAGRLASHAKVSVFVVR